MKNLLNHSQTSLTAAARKFDLSAFRKHADLLESVKSTAWETEQIMGYLKHREEDWVVLRVNEHPWHQICSKGANTLLRHDLSGEPIFLLHLQSRWLLIFEGEELVPAIFLFTEDCRDGLPVSFYRIFGGAGLASLKETTKLAKRILEAQPSVEVPPEKTHPYDELYKVNFG